MYAINHSIEQKESAESQQKRARIWLLKGRMPRVRSLGQRATVQTNRKSLENSWNQEFLEY